VNGWIAMLLETCHVAWAMRVSLCGEAKGVI